MIEIAATVNENKFGILSVTNSEQVKAGLDGILIVNGKRALVTRGSSPMAVVGQVFTRFAQECDQTGEPFAFSRERRGSVERDPVFHSIFKVTPVRMREYVLSWFQPCELVQATNGPMMSTAVTSAQALVLTAARRPEPRDQHKYHRTIKKSS